MPRESRSSGGHKKHEEIDAVYLWVDGADPAFRSQLAAHIRNHSSHLAPSSIGSHRFRNSEELRYSLRSLERFAPWVRQVHLLTNGQVPAWLNTRHDRLACVTHERIFPHPVNLPTFNSNAIELQLHRIPNLSRRFLFFADDFLLGQPIGPEDFITPGGGQYLYFDPIPLPAPGPSSTVLDRAYVYTQRLAEQHWKGPWVPYLPAHVPKLFDTGVLVALERRFRREFKATSGHRFRSEDDVVLRLLYARCLEAHSDGHRTKLLQWGSRDYHFLMLQARPWWIWRWFRALRSLKPKFLCVNDDLGEIGTHHLVWGMFRRFLERYCPYPSSFEKEV